MWVGQDASWLARILTKVQGGTEQAKGSNLLHIDKQLLDACEGFSPISSGKCCLQFRCRFDLLTQQGHANVFREVGTNLSITAGMILSNHKNPVAFTMTWLILMVRRVPAPAGLGHMSEPIIPGSLLPTSLLAIAIADNGHVVEGNGFSHRGAMRLLSCLDVIHIDCC